MSSGPSSAHGNVSGMAKKDEFGHWKGSLILTSEKLKDVESRSMGFFHGIFHVVRSLAISLSSSV